MLEEKTEERNGGLVELRRANWLLASSAVRQLGADWDLDDDELEFLCECGRSGCSSTVELSLTRYVEAASRRSLIVASGHQSPLDRVERREQKYARIRRERA